MKARVAPDLGRQSDRLLAVALAGLLVEHVLVAEVLASGPHGKALLPIVLLLVQHFTSHSITRIRWDRSDGCFAEERPGRPESREQKDVACERRCHDQAYLTPRHVLSVRRAVKKKELL